MWKYQSGNFEHISLHDHCIDKIVSDGNDIFLIFDDGFDIVKTHPLNIMGKSKLTTNAQIVLRNAHFLYREVFLHNQETLQINLSALRDGLLEFEVLEFQNEDEKFILKGILDTAKFTDGFAMLSFSCDNTIFYWNDYSSDAWFED